MYFSSFYCYEHPEPQSYIKSGSYDIGCGGSCGWYITKEHVEADDFCIPYNGERYCFILRPYEKDNKNSICYREFKDKFPRFLDLDGYWCVAFSNDETAIPSSHLDFDEIEGELCEIDLERNKSTYFFEKDGIPIWNKGNSENSTYL